MLQKGVPLMKILVVDDDKEIVQLLEIYIEMKDMSQFLLTTEKKR